MNRNTLNRLFFHAAFGLGLAAIAWVGAGFVGSSAPALLMTLLIGGVYLLGAQEIRRFRATTAELAQALAAVPQPLERLGDWLDGVPAGLRNAVRQRIEGERGALPGLALTPYLIGLLVMLGMLGTFLGMVVTFKGVVFTLEGSADLQAIRSALAAPIKGLGLAFGTSVVGVATSAMLGLMSAMARRERLEASRQLDTQIATVFRPFSFAQQRQATFQALQQQAGALPAVADQLQALIERIDQRSQQLDEQLLARQARFHQEATEAYSGLARSVERSLQDSLAAATRAAGDSLRPVVGEAMAGIAQEASRLHERVHTALQAQVDELSGRLGAATGSVADTWTRALQQHTQAGEAQAQGLARALEAFSTTFETRSAALVEGVQASLGRAQAEQGSAAQQRLAAWMQALQQHAQASEQQVQGLDRALGAFTSTFEQRCAALITGVQDTVARSHAEQNAACQQQQADWTQALQALAGRLQHEWQQAGAQALAQQQAAQLALAQAAERWRDELGALRREEAERGEAAVQRLGALESALNAQVAGHLTSLGTALEAPMARLLESAAEAPQAAAEVIAQLRQDMSRLGERDNLALQERASLMGQIESLLQSVQQATGEQRSAIESLVQSAGAVLDQVGRQFADTVGAQAVRAEDVAAQVSGSAIELASLGEAFGHGVQLFSDTNEKLIQNLQRIEGAVTRSIERSDEQLAYYVAQAREVIDLSISSQQGILDDLRRLRSPATEGAAA